MTIGASGAAAARNAAICPRNTPVRAHPPSEQPCAAQGPLNIQCSRRRHSEALSDVSEWNATAASSNSSDSSQRQWRRRRKRSVCHMPAPSNLLLLLFLLLGISSAWTAQAAKIVLSEGSRECISEELAVDPLQGAPPGGKLRVEAALSLRPRHTAVGAVPQPASTVEVQLMGGRPAVALTNTQHVTQEALVTASVDGPGTYALCFLNKGDVTTVDILYFSLSRVREVGSDVPGMRVQHGAITSSTLLQHLHHEVMRVQDILKKLEVEQRLMKRRLERQHASSVFMRQWFDTLSWAEMTAIVLMFWVQSWGIQRFFAGQPSIRRKSSGSSLSGIIRRISSGVGVGGTRTASVIRTASRYSITDELPRTTSSRRRLNTADSTESDPGPRLLTSSSSDGGRPSGPLSSGADLPAARASGSSPPKGQKLEPRFLVVAGVKLGHVGCPNGRSRNSECSAGGVYGAAQAVAHPARLNLGGRGGESVPSPVMRRYGSSGSLFTMQDGHAMLTPADHGGNMGASSRSLSHAGTSLGLRLNSDPLPDSVPEHTEALMQDCVHATSLSSIQVHTSVCVPPKWRNPSKASYLSSSGTISGDDPGAVLARAASVSVPESNYYMHSSRARNWKRAWVLPIDREAAGEGTNANGFHMRTCSSSSLESVDIPVTG